MSTRSLFCPVDLSELSTSDSHLRCAAGHLYDVDTPSGVPALFDPSRPKSMHAQTFADPLRRKATQYPSLQPGDIDAFVQDQIAGTGGNLYKRVRLRTYPTPRFPLTMTGPAQSVLDVGSGWGRWAMAAALEGWTVTAIDPWIDCCRALIRVRDQRNLESIQVINADGQRLPFPDNYFDASFSYSVIQHLDKSEARIVLEEMVRVVAPGGVVLVQMPNARGLRQRMLKARGIVADTGFSVRPWTIDELSAIANDLAPASWTISADGFLSLNAQWTERSALPLTRRAVVAASELVRRASRHAKPLTLFADSVWIRLVVP